MVEETFKVNISLDLDQTSLAELRRKIQKAISDELEASISKGTRARRPTGRPGAGVLDPATTRSIRDSVKVTSELDKAAQALVQAANKLTRAAEKSERASTRPQSRRQNVESTQIGPSNRNRGRDIDTSRQEAGRQRSGGSTTQRRDNLRRGDERDSARYQQSAKRRVEARERPMARTQTRMAEAQAAQINKVLSVLRQQIQNIFPKRPGIAKEVGLPARAEVGPGASVILKDLGGNVKVASQSIEVFEGKLKSVTNTLASVLNNLSAGAGGKLARVSKRAGIPGAEGEAVSMLRRELRRSLSGLGNLEPGRVSLGYQKGGETDLTVKLTAEQRKRVIGLKNNRDQLVEVNKILQQTIDSSDKFRKSLRAMGIEMLSSVGIQEDIAAQSFDISKLKDEGLVRLRVQARNIPGMGIGGAAAIKQTRNVQVQQALQVQGGRPSRVTGTKERSLLQEGLINKRMGRELRTALVDLPETMEDQILVTKEAAKKMKTVESQTLIVTKLSQDIADTLGNTVANLEVGQRAIVDMELSSSRIVGQGAGGQAVEFGMKGERAKITGVEKISDGVRDGFRLVINELKPMVSGGKLTMQGGHKGKVRVVKDLGTDPEGRKVEAAIGRKGLLKRQNIAVAIEMVSTRMADQTKMAAQTVADKIIEIMEGTGAALDVAAQQVAEGIGLGKGYTGAADITGGRLGQAAGGRARTLYGGAHFRVLPGEGVKGPAEVKPRMMSRTDMEALKVTAQGTNLIKVLAENMGLVRTMSEDLIKTLLILANEGEVVSENLQEMLPESIKRLPIDEGNLEDLKGTLLGIKEAFNMVLPTKGGGSEMFRVPAMGKGLGARGKYESPLGAIGPNPLTRLLDNITKMAMEVRVSRGEAGPEVSSEAQKESALAADKSLNRVIDRINELGTESEKGAKAFDNFMKFFMPLIDRLQGPVNIQWKNLATGTIGSTEKKTAGEYVRGQKSPYHAMMAVRDVLGFRRPTKGKGTESIAKAGAMFDVRNMELLKTVMDKLGVTTKKDVAEIERLENSLEALKQRFVELTAAQLFGTATGKGIPPERRRMMEQVGGGASVAPYLKALNFATDVGPALKQARDMLQQLAETGQDVGGALKALEEIEAAQPEEVIPQDAMIINQTDFKNWAGELARTHGISTQEAEKRLLERPTFTQRWPTTGPASFLARKVKVGDVPEGHVGLPSTIGQPGAQQLPTLLKSLQAHASSLEQVIVANEGVGEAADMAAAELVETSKMMQALQPVMKALQQNLDFDGDAIIAHSDVVSDTSQTAEKFIAGLDKGTNAFWSVISNLINKLEGQFVGGGVTELAQDFTGLAKGRKGLSSQQQQMTLMTQSAETRAQEAFTHVSPKMMVGLATDAYNKFMMGAIGGLEELDAGLRAGVGYMMLNINEALGQKHGGGGKGQLPSLQLVEDITKGKFTELEDQMGAGGRYEDLGKKNEEMTSKLRGNLRGKFLGEGAGKFQDFMKTSGFEELIPKEGLGMKNFGAVIESMVKKSDLKSVFKRIHETIINNLRESLRAQGVVDIESQIQAMLKSKKPGDMTKVITQSLHQMFPEFTATRKSFVDAIQDMPAIEQIKMALTMIPEHIMNAILGNMGGTDFAVDLGDISNAAGPVLEQLKELMRGVSGQYSSIGKGEMADLGRPASTVGFYSKGQDQIRLSAEKVVKPILEVMKDLESMASGRMQATPGIIKAMLEVIQRFGGTLAHEGVHKISKRTPGPARSIAEQLEAGYGGKGVFAGVAKPMLQRLHKLPGMAEKGRAAKAAQQSGAANAGALKKEYMRSIGEETLGYAAGGQLRELFGDLPKEVIAAIETELNVLREASPELIDTAMSSTKHIVTSLITSIASALEGEGAAGEGDLESRAREMARKRVEALTRGATLGMEAPGGQRVELGRYRLQAAQRMLSEARGTFGMQATKGGKYLEGPNVLGPESAAGRINEMLRQAQQGDVFRDPTASSDLEREFRAESERYQGRMKGAEGYEEVDVWGQYQKMMREFQAAKAQYLVNEARKANAAMGELEATGGAGTNEYADLVKRFSSIMQELQSYLTEVTYRTGRGAGRMTSITGRPSGALFESAKEMGITPDRGLIEGQIQSVRGRTDLEKAQFEPVANAVREIVQRIEQGSDATEEWGRLFRFMAESPKTFKDNMGKVKEVMAAISGIFVMIDGKASNTSQAFMELSSNAGVLVRAMKSMKIENLEDLGRLAHKTASTLRTMRVGGGEDITQSMKEQLEEADAMAREQAERLTKYYRETGKTTFEPQKFKIVDPETGRVIQQVEARFKKSGGAIKHVMAEIGQASQRTGRRLRDAFRRVVQWGFASGIVYGTLRAFRALISTITEVQTGMFQLKKVMDVSITDFNKMQDAAVGMAKGFGIAINEVIEGMVVYGQQGLETNEILERTRATLLAVNTTTLSSTEATEALTAAHKVFGETMDTSTGFVDAWGAVAAQHAITAKDLADAVKRSGAAADVAGVGFADFMGIITAIGAVTRQTGKEIATGTKFMFRAMRRPTAQKELGRIGIRSVGMEGELRPAMSILSDVAKQWENLSRAQQISLAQSMAGIRHYNAFIVLMNNFNEAIEASIDAQNSNGFAARKHALAMQTLSKQIQVLKETWKGLALSIGKAILPIATGGTKALRMLMDVASKLPPVFMQVGAVGAAGILALHKAADLTLDSLEAMFGYDARAAGAGGSFKAMGRALKKPFEGMGEAGDLSRTTKDFGVIGKGAHLAIRGVDKFAVRMALLTMNVPILGKAVDKLASKLFMASKAFKLAFAGTVIGAGIIAIWALNKGYQELTKSAKEYENELFNQIGQSKDAAQQLKNQYKYTMQLEHAYSAIQSSLRAVDTKGLDVLFSEGGYVTATAAASEYNDILYDIAKKLAEADPALIEGITESGDLVVEMSSNLSELTDAAVDAQNALTAALQIKVIKAYGDELKEVQGIFKKSFAGTANFFQNLFGQDEGDYSLLGQLKESRDALDQLFSKQKELAAAGMSVFTVQQSINSELEHYNQLQSESVVGALEIKRLLEEMPTFENMGMAQAMYNRPGLIQGVGGSAAAGGFGRGATTGSVIFRQMAKQMGMGGLVGYKGGASAANLYGQFAGRGIAPGEKIKGGRSGAAIISTEAARSLLGPMASEAAIEAARSVLVSVDKVTGESIYGFWDGVHEQWIHAAADSKGIIEEGTQLFFDENVIRKAAENSKKMLTLQFTGALAGIRIPPNVQLGPATRRQVTAEQRAFGELPEEMDRLATIQAETTQMAKEYNEVLSGAGESGESVSSAFIGMTENSKKLKIMTIQTKEALKLLMEEGFQLSVIGHFTQAMHELNMVMENAEMQIRDATIEEQTRAEFMKHTSGALKGLAVLPELQLGKTRRELSGAERLQAAGAPIGRVSRGIQMAEKQRDIQVQALTDIRKKIATFDEMRRDLGQSYEELLAQFQEDDELEGLSDTAKATIKTIDRQGMLAEKVGDKQIDLQQRMLKSLKAIEGYEEYSARIDAAKNDDERAAIRQERSGAMAEKAAKMGAKELRNVLVQGLGPRKFANIMTQMLGVKDIGGRKGYEAARKPGFAGLSSEGQSQLEEIQKQFIEVATNQAKELGMMSGKPLQAIKSAERMGNLDAGLSDIELAFLAIPEVAQRLGELNAAALEGGEVASRKAKETEDNRDKNLKLIEQRKAELYNKMNQTQSALAGEIEKTNNSLMAGARQAYNMSIASANFAKTIEEMVDGFKKADELVYQKIKSDLEGPFARVGKPGFKTDFESRREAAEKKLYGRGSRAEKAEAQKELDQVKFDEKEAKIKQKQDVEVAALRQQQQQAEQLRSKISDALYAGEITDPDMINAAQRFRDQLTDELATSEQATMGRGGRLSFKGLPSLEEASRFGRKFEEAAKQKMQESEMKMYKAGITDPLANAFKEQFMSQEQWQKPLLSSMEVSLKSLSGEATKAGGAGGAGMQVFSPTGLVDTLEKRKKAGKGPMNLTEYYHGLANTNQLSEWRSRSTTGNATATSSSVQNITGPSGRQEEPGTMTGGIPRGDPMAATTATGRASEELLAAIDALNASIAGLTEGGLRLPDDFSSTIGELGTSITDALGETLDVNVTNDTLIAEISNLDEVTEAFESSGLSGVGAQVTTLGLQLEELQADLDPGGTIETQITEAVGGVSASAQAAVDAAELLTERVLSIEESIEGIEGVDGLTEQVTGFGESLDELDGRVEIVEDTIENTIIPGLESNAFVINEFQTETIPEFTERLEEVEAIAVAATESIGIFEETLEGINTGVETAVTNASAALETVEETQESLTTFIGQTFENRAQNIEQTIRTRKDEIDKIDVRITEVENVEIPQLKTLAQSINNKAGQALNLAQAAQKV